MKFYRRHKHELNHTEEDEPLPLPPEKKMRYSRSDDVLLARFFSNKPEGTSDKIFQGFARDVSFTFPSPFPLPPLGPFIPLLLAALIRLLCRLRIFVRIPLTSNTDRDGSSGVRVVVQHPHHPWKGWQEHHRIHKAKIDHLIQKLAAGEVLDENEPQAES